MQTTFAANLDQEFAQVVELFSPRGIAVANGQCVKVARVKAEFVWHSHANADEFFQLREATLLIRDRERDRDRADVVPGDGDFHVVPRGVEHMTAAPEECWLVLFEPATREHTGDSRPELTVSIERQLAHLSAAPQQPRAQET